jgi:crotonobetainyl-CoA:carnitine CoA-transferase CaiB-like acyl-CoA transferase
MFAVTGILLALRARERTGMGQFVDVSMLDSMISTMTSNYASYLGSGVVPGPMGTAFPTVVPYRVYQAKDRAVAVAVGSEKLWSAFCCAIERPELEKHSDYETNAKRVRNRAALEPLLEDAFRKQSGYEWIGRLQAAGVPVSLVRNFQEVVENPHSEARSLFPKLDHPTAGPHRVTGTPVKLSATPGGPGEPAPRLGQHTSDVLKEMLGLDDCAIRALVTRRVIFDLDIS